MIKDRERQDDLCVPGACQDDIGCHAALHAQTYGEAGEAKTSKGERFLAIAGESMWLADAARVLKQRTGPAAKNVSTRVLPNTAVRLGALKDPALRGAVSLLGLDLNASSEKAMCLLGCSPRSREEAIVATAESLVRLGLLHSQQ